MKHSSWYPAIFYQTGTASLTPNSVLVTGINTNWDQTMVNCQFRVGAPPSNFPTYTIVQVISPTQLILDTPWIGQPITSLGYQIFQCYFTVPADFNYFYSLINPTANYRLSTNVTQATLDQCDPQRVQTGITFAAAFYDYSQTYQGSIGPILQVRGGGSSPVSSTSYGYAYPENSVYSVEITVTGAPGGALTFQWKQDNGSTTIVAVPDNTAIDLSNGVQIYFPAATYTAGDVFVIQCQAGIVSGVPRYELWPRPINTPFVYPFLYVAKLPALSNEQPQLPDFVARRGDILLEMALASCARWPGTDTMRNPYYDLQLASMHEGRSEKMIWELEKKDDDVAIKDLKYDNLGYYPAPWLDGSWLQRHAIYPG